MKFKIGAKLLTSYFILVFITFVIVGSLLNPLFRNYLITAKKNELVHKANEIIALTQKYHDNEIDEETFRQVVETLDRFIDTPVLVVNKEGLVIVSSLRRPRPGRNMPLPIGSRLSQEEVGQVLSGQTVVQVRKNVPRYFSTPMISVAVPVTRVNATGVQEVTGAVFTLSPVFHITDIVKKAYYSLGISVVVAALLAAAIAYYFTRKISLPLKNMNEAALSMAQGDYRKVIEPAGDDEIGELATSLNYLGRQLDSNINALQEEKRKLESIVKSLNEGLIAVDKEGRIMLANPVVENIFMTPPPKLIGRLLAEVSPLPELAAPFADALKSKEAATASFKLVHSTYKVLVAPIKQEKGELLGAVGILQDISEMEKVEQLRRDFIANVSHELRAPITVIRGYADCLLDGVAGNPSEHYYSIIKNETLRLERLINNIMELSLLQSGKAELYLEEVNLSQLVYETVNKFVVSAGTKGVRLTTAADPKREITVYCDADRIEQLLIILLDNALKFTPAGGFVEVFLREEEGKILLRVEDSGAGIAEEDIPFIWERFYKADKSRNRQHENGTGLGLFIAKQIANLHQAELTVESKPNEGSAFTLWLKKE